MEETISKRGLRDHGDVVWWALLHSIREDLGDDDRGALFTEDDSVRVSLEMNGVPVSFEKVVTALSKQYWDRVEEAARKLVKEAAIDFSDRMHCLADEFETRVRDELRFHEHSPESRGGMPAGSYRACCSKGCDKSGTEMWCHRPKGHFGEHRSCHGTVGVAWVDPVREEREESGTLQGVSDG